eukprot:scaffold1809_cov228-Pinguiococcus_pyrenoidosus.AAC.3
MIKAVKSEDRGMLLKASFLSMLHAMMPSLPAAAIHKAVRRLDTKAEAKHAKSDRDAAFNNLESKISLSVREWNSSRQPQSPSASESKELGEPGREPFPWTTELRGHLSSYVRKLEVWIEKENAFRGNLSASDKHSMKPSEIKELRRSYERSSALQKVGSVACGQHSAGCGATDSRPTHHAKLTGRELVSEGCDDAEAAAGAAEPGSFVQPAVPGEGQDQGKGSEDQRRLGARRLLPTIRGFEARREWRSGQEAEVRGPKESDGEWGQAGAHRRRGVQETCCEGSSGVKGWHATSNRLVVTGGSRSGSGFSRPGAQTSGRARPNGGRRYSRLRRGSSSGQRL